MALPHLTTIDIEGIEILQLIGSGGAGDVYKAIIPSFAGGRAVAIKVVRNPRRFSAYVVANAYQ
jgi:serine/threonine protein kinase